MPMLLEPLARLDAITKLARMPDGGIASERSTKPRARCWLELSTVSQWYRCESQMAELAWSPSGAGSRCSSS